MSNGRTHAGMDWAGSLRGYALAWGLPHLALLLGLAATAPLRGVIWSITLAWMGIACMINARRCSRTHCRYSGPFFLSMFAPVVVLASGMASAGIYGWLLLGALKVAGGKLIWWMTERAWGKFS